MKAWLASNLTLKIIALVLAVFICFFVRVVTSDTRTVEGVPVEIAFNVRYVIEVLSVIDTPQVVLETTRSDRPGVIRPVGAGPEEFTHVIMPMQLQR